MGKAKSDYAIQAIVNAASLLRAFGDEEELGVTPLARRLGLHKNNVFRILATLEQEGFIEQNPLTECYRLGVRCLELGQSYARSQPLLVRARPLLAELSAATGETAHLGALCDFEVVHLDARAADRLVQTPSRVGRRLPAHCTALGKILLGCSPGSVREAYDRRAAGPAGLSARTGATIVDAHKLLEHVAAAALRGFALDLEECEPGLSCAAAPVLDASGAAVAAVSVSGPSFRLTEARLIGEVVPRVTSAAERLSRDLGFASQSQ